ncbi:MAG: dihydroorotase [Ilumatobacteraceae bacterium]|nr:dihydroorotase [Ilumatobacteraceae bacterium]
MSKTAAELVFQNASIVHPAGVEVGDVAIAGGLIIGVGSGLTGKKIIDATGLHLSSGFVDLHTHLREPGKEEAETIETGSRAAALGGYTAVIAMPNTDPSQDCVAVVNFVRQKAIEIGLCEVVPSACITVGRRGEQLVPFAALHEAGVRIFTDDGNGVQDPLIMRRALEYSRDLDIVLAQHCEVSRLTEGAVMHEGECCSALGVPGWPSLAEELMLHRDIELVRLTGAPMHFLHLSTAGSIELVRRAKADGLPVTAEVTPHHLALTDDLLVGFDSVFKVNPPLRTRADIQALKDGVADGTIDAIATDHAPHAAHTKDVSIDSAPPGMLGLETALGVVNTALSISVVRLVELLSWNPARIAGIQDRHGRPIAVGEVANISVWSSTDTWNVSRDGLASKSKNTPYHGMKIRGKVKYTVFNGELVVDNEKAVR